MNRETPIINRETWLLIAADTMRYTTFQRAGMPVPDCKVSVGFPGGGSARKRIGEAWPPQAASDHVSQVFISPVLDDAVQVLAVLAHELIHVMVPAAGHKTPFKRIALAIGLTGKMTATVAGPGLTVELETMAAQLGPYPHAALSLTDRKKQGTRLNKVECQDCGYTCRVTGKWLDEVGSPICPCNNEPMNRE